METDQISRIEIDQEGRLHIFPANLRFPLVYRTATEVHWNPERKSLYSPKPRDWTYFEWFKHIIDVIEKEVAYKLQLTDKTEWINISEELRTEIKKENETNFDNNDSLGTFDKLF